MGVVVGIALVWFIIEILVWYLVAQFISGWLVFLWFIVAAFIGFGLLKKAFGTLNPVAQQFKSGVIPNPANQPPKQSMLKAVGFGLAGVLLLLPGLLSDIAAFLVLLPAIQNLLSNKAENYAKNNQDKMMAMMAKHMGGNSPFGNINGMGGMSGGFGQNSPFGGGFGGTTIDGKATIKQKSANDD